MNYNKLFYFIKIAENGNISETAEQLYISQPALSLQLKEFEEQMGFKLFKRGRRLKLTQEGEILYQWAKPFFDQEESVLQSISSLQESTPLTLTIGTLGSNLMFQIPRYAETFKKCYPEINIVQKRMSWKKLNDALSSSEIDIAFSIWVDSINDEYENYEKIFIEKGYACIVVSASHQLSQKKEISFDEVKGYPIALLDRKLEPLVYNQTIKGCQKLGFTPNIVAEYPYIEPLLTAVEFDEAITSTSTLAPIHRFQNLRQIKLVPEISMWSVMLWKADNSNPAVSLFCDDFINNIKSLTSNDTGNS